MINNGLFSFNRKAALCSLFALAFCVVFGVYWIASSRRMLVALAAVACAAGVATLVYLYKSDFFSREKRCYLSAVGLIGLFCIVFAFAFPPFTVPDEVHHYFSSYWLADCVTGESSLADGSYVPVRESDWDMYEVHARNVVDSTAFEQVATRFSLFDHSDATHIVDIFNFSIGSENIFAKLGSTLGILVGKILNLGPLPMFYLGRIMSAMFFVACVGVAIWITPVFKSAFALVALLPMTLHLAASYSYDGGIIGIAFVASAAVLNAIFGEGRITTKDAGFLIVAAALLSPLKIVYASVFLLVPFIPARRFAHRNQKITLVALVFLAAIISLISLRAASVGSMVSSGGSSLDFRGTESGHFYNLSDFLNDPLSALALFARTIDSSIDFYVMSMLGYSLGWFQSNISMPMVFTGVYLLILVFAVQDGGDGVKISNWLRLACIAVFSLCVLGCMMSMALGWTFNTESVIQGVQGRYFLPLLPLLSIIFRSDKVRLIGSPAPLALTVFASLNALYLVRYLALALIG